MTYRLLADAVVLLHFGFILFVLFGGLFALRWPRVAWLHVPTALWGALVEFMGWICPLTPLENALREAGGEAGYSGSFVERYLLPVMYPLALTRGLQIVFGVAVVAANLVIYFTLFRRRRGDDRS